MELLDIVISGGALVVFGFAIGMFLGRKQITSKLENHKNSVKRSLQSLTDKLRALYGTEKQILIPEETDDVTGETIPERFKSVVRLDDEVEEKLNNMRNSLT